VKDAQRVSVRARFHGREVIAAATVGIVNHAGRVGAVLDEAGVLLEDCEDDGETVGIGEETLEEIGDALVGVYLDAAFRERVKASAG
jgi:hypothetical protein